MEKLFEQYQEYISALISFASEEDTSQSHISQEERDLVAAIENEYSQTRSELQNVRDTVSAQYKSVRDSCCVNAGLRRPEAQRPSKTDANLQDCVRIQEHYAKKIKVWLDAKAQQAVAAKQRKLQQEAEQGAARALSAAEAERKRKEEAALLEERRGAALLEEMKRKFRSN